MKKTNLLILTLLAFVASSANAGLITYTDRTSFETANPGLANEDFEDVINISQVLAGTNIEPGLSLALTSGTDAYFATPGQSSNPTNAIGVNTPRSEGWELTFSSNVTAVGVDIFQNNGGGAQFGQDIFAAVDVFGNGGLLGSFLATIPSGQAGFFGVTSDSDLITSITINERNSFDVIDNVSFGSASSVPEPATITLLGLGLLGFGLSKRRKS